MFGNVRFINPEKYWGDPEDMQCDFDGEYTEYNKYKTITRSKTKNKFEEFVMENLKDSSEIEYR